MWPEQMVINFYCSKYTFFFIFVDFLFVVCDFFKKLWNICVFVSTVGRERFATCNPLSPNLIIQILLTGLHSFCWLLIEKTCLNTKTIHVWGSFAKFSWSVCVIIHWYDDEKFGADHYWCLKGWFLWFFSICFKWRAEERIPHNSLRNTLLECNVTNSVLS